MLGLKLSKKKMCQRTVMIGKDGGIILCATFVPTYQTA
jgi:hypothetical protein